MSVIATILIILLAVVAFSISLSLLLPVLLAGAIYFILRSVIGSFNDRVASTFLDGGFGVAVFIIILWLVL